MERKAKGGKRGGESRRREGKGGGQKGERKGRGKSCVMAVRGMDAPQLNSWITKYSSIAYGLYMWNNAIEQNVQ